MLRESLTFPLPSPNPGDELPLSMRMHLAHRSIDNLMTAIVDQMEALAAYMKELEALRKAEGVSNG